MNTVSDLILFAGIIGLIVALAKPTAFTRFLKGNKPTRKKLGLIFGGVVVLALVLLALGPQPQKTTKTSAHAQAANTTTATNTANSPSSADTTSNSAPQAATTPALRQDLAFQGDATYCDATYKANDNGTTTWTLNIKQAGELITHLSDKSGHIYRHDNNVGVGYTAYTADVNINDVSEINGVLYIGNDSHPCNIAPAS